MSHARFHPDLLRLDCSAEAARIEEMLKRVVLRQFRKRGLVVGLSGGIDSSVVATIATRALGRERVFGLLMPERDSADETLTLSRTVAEHLGIDHALEDISLILDAAGCYKRRDDAIKRLIPDYSPGDKCKLVLPPLTEQESYRLFKIVVQHKDGRTAQAALDLKSYLTVVAASNF